MKNDASSYPFILLYASLPCTLLVSLCFHSYIHLILVVTGYALNPDYSRRHLWYGALCICRLELMLPATDCCYHLLPPSRCSSFKLQTTDFVLFPYG
ncbi:hypothetical protein L2E82_40969 [Cichorium intybus]|uniref:Uncharacterized protein n=1 Tax=Cichorium intybus TaxID=13427 RepID=A0ACB9AN98_CICIN|nr:hypothetical protein L2E82_40969 [Cichorium intybus]